MAEVRALRALFSHIFLPPRLPGSEDEDVADIQNVLNRRLLSVARELRDKGHNDYHQALNKLCRTLSVTQEINEQGTISRQALIEACHKLDDGDYVVLHIAAQNGGLVLRRKGDEFIFDAFEASAKSSEVLASTQALRWSFPGSSVAVPAARLLDKNFLEPLARFLEQASQESLHHFAVKASKANADTPEIRDAADPSLVTDMLVTLLEINGRPIDAQSVHKRVRDDAVFSKNSPWRRLPYWLVLRVAMQQALQRDLGEDDGHATFKHLLCMFMQAVLHELHAQGIVPLEDLAFGRSKLARRLAKLSREQDAAVSASTALTHKRFFNIVRDPCASIMQEINSDISISWEAIRAAHLKKIVPPPSRASNNDLWFKLPNSGSHLSSILNPATSTAAVNATIHRHIDPSQCSSVMDSYIQLLTSEESLRLELVLATPSNRPSIARYHEAITAYLAAASNWKLSGPQCYSEIVLAVMEYWVAMDKVAIDEYPILRDHPLPFSLNMFELLQLSTLRDMTRLNNIEIYLQYRIENSQPLFPTIFGEPSFKSFATRFFDRSQNLQVLLDGISQQAERDANTKRAELQEANRDYNQQAEEETRLDHTKVPDPNDRSRRIHTGARCRKCYLQRCKRRAKIEIFENPLPTSANEQKAVCFELDTPAVFSLYREMTWTIICELGDRKLEANVSPQIQLPGYAPLRSYAQHGKGSLNLASSTKPFLNTHYRHLKLPAALADVCKPSGLTLRLYDSQRQVWVANNVQSPSLVNLLTEELPPTSALRFLQSAPDYRIDKPGPTPNAVIADHAKCPGSMGADEFLAYGDLHIGHDLQWLRLLRELDSSHINFGATSTQILLKRLALQVGPRRDGHLLRRKHWLLDDLKFCESIVGSIALRIASVSSNWREWRVVESMLIILLQIASLTTRAAIKDLIGGVLSDIRSTALAWARSLRNELWHTQDNEQFEMRRCDVIRACLLVRQTLRQEAVSANQVLKPEFLEAYVESSIMLQQCLEDSYQSASPAIRSALISDWRLFFCLDDKLTNTIQTHSASLARGITNAWYSVESPILDALRYWSPPANGWYTSTTAATTWSAPQQVDYHLQHGYFLLDGVPLGKIPSDFRNDPTVRSLFGDQPLFAYSSGLAGMRYKLAIAYGDQHVHFGLRNGRTVIRAENGSQTLELVDRGVFYGIQGKADLPGLLLDDSSHWLDLTTGELEIRPPGEIWKTKKSNWFLHLNNRSVMRHNVRHRLVDPHSRLFKSVEETFGDFEHRDHIILYQAEGGDRALTLQMKRLDLIFKARNGSWVSDELRAQLAEDQDAGLWYGLKSKLVMQDRTNPRLRSVVVPFGVSEVESVGNHVNIRITGVGQYGRFTIDPTLQRLSCAAEPALIYLKAYYFALTSYLAPDPLTECTGTESALDCLQAANALPWTPLSKGPRNCLDNLAAISPFQQYYPRGGLGLQRVDYSGHLSTSAQHEGYCLLVDNIIRRSTSLEPFHGTSQASAQSSSTSKPEAHLLSKSLGRRWLCHSSGSIVAVQGNDDDKVYEARDRLRHHKKRTQVAETVYYLLQQPEELPMPTHVGSALEKWSDLRGFFDDFDEPSLAELATLDGSQAWASLVNLCRSSPMEKAPELMFLLGTLCFTNALPIEVIQLLVAYNVLNEIKLEDPPLHDSYQNFKMGETPTRAWFKKKLQGCRVSFQENGDSSDAHLSLIGRRQLRQLKAEHDRKTEAELANFINDLLEQWPDPDLECPAQVDKDLLKAEEAMDVVREDWQRMAHNHELSNYLDHVHAICRQHGRESPQRINLQVTGDRSPQAMSQRYPIVRIFEDLASSISFDEESGMDLSTTDEVFMPSSSPANQVSTPSETPPAQPFSHRELSTIIQKFAHSSNQTRNNYGNDLKRSMAALEETQFAEQLSTATVDLGLLREHVNNYAAKIAVLQNSFRQSLQAETSYLWLERGDLAPRCTVTQLLQALVQGEHQFKPSMREKLVLFAVSLTCLQRLTRIESAVCAGLDRVTAAELANIGHTNWQPSQCPAWLLLELESNLLIRPSQIEVARATIAPASGSNSVLQMNMGEGKTSVVIPMAVVLLANRQSLVRVMVPKPLLPQIAIVLQTQIGSMLGRTVVHVPFSRRTPTDSACIANYEALHRSTMATAGVMLVLPEHVLSFKLSGMQRLLDGRHEEAVPMMRFQSWLDKLCRDILDESDYTLATRTMLVYPSGAQRLVDGHPHRWITVEKLLQLVGSILHGVRRNNPHGLSIDQRTPKHFPVAHFLREDAENELIETLSDRICRTGGGLISLSGCSPNEFRNVKDFIGCSKMSAGNLRRLENTYGHRSAEWKTLLLLRGLIGGRILVLALKKRWNVQYGLHPQRAPISVPFIARMLPSDTAEWGHPDIALLLTCLSFYYAGISITQFRQSLGHLLHSEDKETEYDRWAQSTTSLRHSLRDCHSINMDDEGQLKDIWQSLSHSTVVIDYYLNHFAFPIHAQQFEFKLQASGWDIPLTRPTPTQLHSTGAHDSPIEAKDIPHCTLSTGFSGTSDSKAIQPMNIKQNDLKALMRTNAEVLTYLLEPRNQEYVVAADQRGIKLSEAALLRLINDKNIRILIDAGAQILEHDNLDLVKAWLQRDYRRPAAVLFINDKASVYHRQGHLTPLSGSPYADDLSECLVYLDEAHTRGTDLKLPTTARAALTIGLGQSKDVTVQAAMRLRKLGTTQSVVFFAPPEVDRSLREYRDKGSSKLTSSDVVDWLLEQSCKGLEQLQPLFLSQGIDYCLRQQARADNPHFMSNPVHSDNLFRVLKQKENHSLRDQYMPKDKSKESFTDVQFTVPEISSHIAELKRIQAGLVGADINTYELLATQEVEQEREISHEVETVREVQRPRPRKAVVHLPLSGTVCQFSVDGVLRPSDSYQPAFNFMNTTHVGSQFGVYTGKTHSRLFVTRDFALTVETPAKQGPDDSYLKPVQWVLYSRVDNTALILSAHEAELLIPYLRTQVKGHMVHLILYSAPVTRKMLAFDDLNYFAIPALPFDWRAPPDIRRDLRIFAGATFFKFQDYEYLCKFLGVQTTFGGTAQTNDRTAKGSLTEKPLRFLQQWLAVRRHGHEFSQSPMGYLVEGKEITADLPFFADEQTGDTEMMDVDDE